MGCDFGAIDAGQWVKILITVNGPVEQGDGERFCEDVNRAIDNLRARNVDVQVQQIFSRSLSVSLGAASAQQAEALAMRVKDLLAREGLRATVKVEQVPK
jgi:hypothetical protein